MSRLDEHRVKCEYWQQVFLVLPSPDNKVYTLCGGWDGNLKPVYNVFKYHLPKNPKDKHIGTSIYTYPTLEEGLAHINKEFSQFYPKD